jgi:hypothetical protein
MHHTRFMLLVLISKELRNEPEVEQTCFACLFRLMKICCLYHAFDKSMRLIKEHVCII